MTYVPGSWKSKAERLEDSTVAWLSEGLAEDRVVLEHALRLSFYMGVLSHGGLPKKERRLPT